ncbi:hypothetical protein TNCV_4627661 [Trichonephila clavipes]|nr:hypothetical protein TNCV_4627661 [Trichonephila clavipes]
MGFPEVISLPRLSDLNRDAKRQHLKAISHHTYRYDEQRCSQHCLSTSSVVGSGVTYTPALRGAHNLTITKYLPFVKSNLGGPKPDFAGGLKCSPLRHWLWVNDGRHVEHLL